MVDQKIDPRDYAGGAGEHLTPFGERPVGDDDGGLVFVATADDLEQQAGVAVAVGQVTDFIDQQQLWPRIMVEPALERAVAVLVGDVAEHRTGGSEQHGVTFDTA